MYKITIFTLLLITTITFIIMMGCGGDSNTTSPNISTPTPDPSKTAYIKIKVQWPSRGEEGKYIISSKNGEELTASITKDTQGIKFYVYDNRDLNISPKPIIGTADIAYPNTSTTIKVCLDNAIVNPNDPNDFTNILPMIPVIVRAEAYQMVTFNPTPPDTYENLISATEKDYTIKLGLNQINLNLGDYTLTVSVSPSTIYPPAYKSISTGYENENWLENAKYAQVTPPLHTSTPGPSPTAVPKPYSALITANLRLVYPPDTDQNGTPIPTTTPKPVAGKTIRFTVVSGDGVLDSYTAVTDENGNCSVNVSAGDGGNISETDDIITLRADFQADPSNPNSTYTASCVVNVKYIYSLALKRVTTDEIYVNTPVPVKAVLKRIVDPNDPNSAVPVSGKTINFKADVADWTKVSSTSGITNSNGECSINAIARFCNSGGVAGTFTSNSSDPNSKVYTSRCNMECQRWKDSFDSYNSNWPEPQEVSKNNWIKYYWRMPGDPNVTDTELDRDNKVSNGELQLFGKAYTRDPEGDPNGILISGSTRTCAHRQLQLNNFTIKCKIKNGNDYEDGEYAYVAQSRAVCRGCISITKIGIYNHPLIYFSRDNKIKFYDGSIAADYEANKWYYVEIDYSIGSTNEGNNTISYYNNLYYRIYNSSHEQIVYKYFKRTGFSDWELKERPSLYLTLISESGTVWFDDVEVSPFNF